MTENNTLLVLNGPGLADLSADGSRYGGLTLGQVRDECSALCERLDLQLDFRQTDDEEEMFRWITNDSEKFAGLIINPSGCTKSDSVDFDWYRSAIDLIAHLKKPVVEVHMSNIFREDVEFARPLQASGSEMGFVCGFGKHSYLLAINAVAKRLQS